MRAGGTYEDRGNHCDLVVLLRLRNLFIEFGNDFASLALYLVEDFIKRLAIVVPAAHLCIHASGGRTFHARWAVPVVWLVKGGVEFHSDRSHSPFLLLFRARRTGRIALKFERRGRRAGSAADHQGALVPWHCGIGEFG